MHCKLYMIQILFVKVQAPTEKVVLFIAWYADRVAALLTRGRSQWSNSIQDKPFEVVLDELKICNKCG